MFALLEGRVIRFNRNNNRVFVINNDNIEVKREPYNLRIELNLIQQQANGDSD